MARVGRPPTYTERTRIVLHVEATEAQAMAQCARRAGDPTPAAWARRVLVEAAARDAASASQAAPAATRRRRRAAQAGAS